MKLQRDKVREREMMRIRNEHAVERKEGREQHLEVSQRVGSPKVEEERERTDHPSLVCLIKQRLCLSVLFSRSRDGRMTTRPWSHTDHSSLS